MLKRYKYENLKTVLLCMNIKGWFSLAHTHNISIRSENTCDISVSIMRRTNPRICLTLFTLGHELHKQAHKHKHKHKKHEHVCFSCAYAYAQVTVNNSIRQICGFVLLLVLLLMSRVFSLAYVMLMLVFMPMR